MNIAFIIDPIETLNIKKDSSIAMMLAAQDKGHQIYAINSSDIKLNDQQILATANQISISAKQEKWYQVVSSKTVPLNTFDAVLMRKDPPVDTEYFYITYLLELAEKNGANILNKPLAIRNNNEKLAIVNHPAFIAPTLVTKDFASLKQFVQSHQEVVLKPLDGMGGSSVFKVSQNDPNLNVIIETITQNQNRTIMAQRFIPEIIKGDKRVLLVNGKPIPYSLARIPQKGEIRGNLAVGGTGIAMPLTERELEIANSIGPILSKQGLFIVGLDIIGDYLTEINVTSPTCMQEISNQTDCNVANTVIDALEKNEESSERKFGS